MRITGGEFRGRTFSPPDEKGFRPTMEKVRQAVFSMLNTFVEFPSVSVLDCYSGSGAFGLESLSRGAGHCTFIEKNPALLKFTSTIVDKLDIADSVSLVSGALPGQLEKIRREFELVFADPPYGDSASEFLVKLSESNVLKSGGLLVLETGKSAKEQLPEKVELSLNLLKDKTYGDARIRIFQKK